MQPTSHDALIVNPERYSAAVSLLGLVRPPSSTDCVNVAPQPSPPDGDVVHDHPTTSTSTTNSDLRVNEGRAAARPQSRTMSPSSDAEYDDGDGVDGPLSNKHNGVRRKCSYPTCENRVIQGGVCVTHGARRKGCSHPGCNKAVKQAGKCSTHGPSRRKCDEVGCDRVARQGGRCQKHNNSRQTSVPKFLNVLSKMINEPDNSAIIKLVKDAGYIQIYDRNCLEREILSRYFRHSKYSSFHHRLNYYGFRVIGKLTRGKISPCCYVMQAGAKWDWWWRNLLIE